MLDLEFLFTSISDPAAEPVELFIFLSKENKNMNSSVFLTYSPSPAHLLLYLGWMQAAVKDSVFKRTPWAGRERRPLC